jgi:hypothetical protein
VQAFSRGVVCAVLDASKKVQHSRMNSLIRRMLRGRRILKPLSDSR